MASSSHLSTSSSSSSSSSSTSSGQLPITPRLQPPIQHKQPQHTFAIPAIPIRKPLGMSSTSNLLPANPDHTPIASGSRLKRLSLVSKPGRLDLDGSRSRERERERENSQDGLDLGEGSAPRRFRREGVRSSISYSPAGGRNGFMRSLEEDAGVNGRIDEGEERRSRDDQSLRAGVGIHGRRTSAERVTAMTLSEEHAELLTLIAQRERRVNELRQELAQQEAALSSLKSKWTTIITHSQTSNPLSPIQTPTSTSASTRAKTSHRPRPMSMSLSTSSSSSSQLSSLQESPDIIQPSLASLLGVGVDNVNGLISTETIEGGKRFWGQLVKNVSAAAGGTVPPNEGSEGGGLGNGVDLSSLKSIIPVNLPWTSPTTNHALTGRTIVPPPPRQANASRLRRDMVSSDSAESIREAIARSRIPSKDQPADGKKERPDLSPIEDGLDRQGDMKGKVLTPTKVAWDAPVVDSDASQVTIAHEDDGWGW